ncbi:choice-of-anchor A family protein [Salinisphaera sp. SPP-AMP-43]|uniref:choice-of-anchor A family protein n=1 Tax=Salinisphaera sp. SPP-AMP-43 TaxID=3121288 RepID=UPI003C6DBFE8
MTRYTTALFIASLALSSLGTASATALTAGDILNQYNLVVFDDLDTNSHVDGRTYVGGDLTGNGGDFFQHGSQAAASAYPALIVGGDVSGGDKHVNSNGNALIGGNVSHLTMNGGSAAVGGTVEANSSHGNFRSSASVAIPDFESILRGYSSALAGETGNGSIRMNGSRAIFSADPNQALTVFNISGDFFNGVNEIEVSGDATSRLLINVDGNPGTIAANFLGDYSSLQTSLIWNFFDASAIDFQRQFRGSILAPEAAITNSNNLEGSVVAGSFYQRGEVHLPGFGNDFPSTEPPSADIPEPPVWLLFFAGVLGLGLFRSRRRASRARRTVLDAEHTPASTV